MEQQRMQLALIFYFWCCYLGSGVGLLAREISFAMTVVVELRITHFSLDPMVLTSNFHCFD